MGRCRSVVPNRLCRPRQTVCFQRKQTEGRVRLWHAWCQPCLASSVPATGSTGTVNGPCPFSFASTVSSACWSLRPAVSFRMCKQKPDFTIPTNTNAFLCKFLKVLPVVTKHEREETDLAVSLNHNWPAFLRWRWDNADLISMKRSSCYSSHTMSMSRTPQSFAIHMPTKTCKQKLLADSLFSAKGATRVVLRACKEKVWRISSFLLINGSYKNVLNDA